MPALSDIQPNPTKRGQEFLDYICKLIMHYLSVLQTVIKDVTYQNIYFCIIDEYYARLKIDGNNCCHRAQGHLKCFIAFF